MARTESNSVVIHAKSFASESRNKAGARENWIAPDGSAGQLETQEFHLKFFQLGDELK